MKTRKIYLASLLLAATMATACEEWLKIEPEYEITDTDLYKNTAGYYKVVNGLYRQMSDFALYGKELSWGMTDVWARYYAIDPASDYKSYPQMYDLEYEAKEAASLASAAWGAGYKIIAQANDLIAHTEKTDDGFFTNEEIDRNTILGEAYAIRAMMHFDLMRLFGASMEVDADGRYIPYVETYPSTVNPPIPNREFMEKTIGDLVKARDLLKTFDVEVNLSYATATTNRFFGSSNPAQGKFYNNRGTRLNYYAVTVLLARACLWAQKTDDALTYAQEIIDLVTAKTLKFSTSGSILSVPKMFDDLLFGFYQEKLTETFEPYVNNTNSRRLTIDDKPFFTTPTNDKRSGFIKTSTNFLTKYTVNVSDEKDKIVPNIRISEAYYIAAECLYKTDMKTAAADLMVVRKARGYSSPVLSGTMTEDAFWEALTYEYRKEFIGEGQLIFFYKRTNRPITFSEGKFDHKGKLTLPVPDSESAI